jgi:hypothetical protein
MMNASMAGFKIMLFVPFVEKTSSRSWSRR